MGGVSGGVILMVRCMTVDHAMRVRFPYIAPFIKEFLMAKKVLNKRELAQVKATKYFVSRGYEVYSPVTENSTNDLLIKDSLNRIMSVKVITNVANIPMKGANSKDSYTKRSYSINITKIKPEQSLICFIQCPNDETFVIPSNAFDGKKKARLGLESTKYAGYKVTV
jgi:hypothetical protein